MYRHLRGFENAIFIKKIFRKISTDAKWENNIGFIGCGNMGACMVKNLSKAEHSLVIFDSDKEKLKSISEENRNCSIGESNEDVSRQCSKIITMLPNTKIVEEVYQTFFKYCRPNTLLIDSSTISPIVSSQISSRARDKRLRMIDAPVSGGVPAAKNGTLTFMVGGTEADFSQAFDVLKLMGSKVVHCGKSGNGLVAKLSNNLALAISMIGISEAMNLGHKMGLDPSVLADVLNSSTAKCWSSEKYNPFPGVMDNVPSSKNFSGGFSADLMEKDLKLAMESADFSGSLAPLGSLAKQLYSIMIENGDGSKDFSGIIMLLNSSLKGPDIVK